MSTRRSGENGFAAGFLFLIACGTAISAEPVVAPSYTLVATPSCLRPGATAVFNVPNVPEGTDFTLSADPREGLTCSGQTCSAPKPPDGVSGKLATVGPVTVTANFKIGTDLKTSSTTVTLGTTCGGPWEARTIIGYHQAGASSADFTQNVMIDLYVVRPLSATNKAWEAKLNSWGNVRIASSPRQLNTPLVSLLQGLVVGGANSPLNTNVNELALSAEFQTGLEWNLTRAPKWNGTMLGLIAFFGATGSFESPDKSIRVYQVPDTKSQQYPLFAARFPSAVGSTYIGFVSPDRDRFYRQYGLGFRYSKYHPNRQYEAPQTYSVTLGQDELITGGSLRSVVARVDGFYPLPINTSNGRFQFLYLFGTASLRLGRGQNTTPLVLAGAPSTVTGTESNVAIVSTPSNRDTYRIGIGVDLVNLVRSALNQQQQQQQQ